MSGELGKASLDLEANLTSFERNMAGGRRSAEGMERTLESLAAISNVADRALNEVGLSPGKAAESRLSASAILEGVRGISEEARDAAREIDHVKITEAQAAESEVAGGLIDRVLNRISRNADQAKRKLTEVRLAGGRTGVGVGPFGSGFGRVGVLGAAIGVGALTAPAAAPAAVGLLAAIPALGFAAVGVIGTLALAFGGLGKAIGGDKKAFDELGPSAQKFVLTIRSLDGWFDKLKQTAAKGLFPGLTAGLHAALSPGTVGVITKAVSELAKALGQVGAQFGRYFGSAEFQKIFGPLMTSAARNIGVMGDAALHLFDALGVLARAAIPFTNWLATAADKGAKLVDSWIHAKDASGELSHGMDEARTSLTLVAHLFGALLKAAFALGQALYPVSKVAVKALTDGLNGLAGIIHRNQGGIREFVGGALKLLIGAVKTAVAGVRLFVGALHAIGGHKAAVVAAIIAIGIVIAATLGPEAAVIIGAIAAVGFIRNHWGALVVFYKTLGREIVNSFKYVWYLLEKGALKAALGVVEPFSHLPGFLGGWARKAKNAMQTQLDKLHPPNMNWSSLAAREGSLTGAAWRQAFDAQAAKNQKALHEKVLNMPPLPFDLWKLTHPGGTHKEYDAYVKSVEMGEKLAKEYERKHHKRQKSSTTSPPPPPPESVFGTPPPFTKNTGSGSKSPIPQTAINLEALARRQDQQAAALHYAGQKAREHLYKEIVDLQKADKILEEKLKDAHGKRRTELYNAVTANLKRIAEARKRLHEALSKGQEGRLTRRQDRLNLALDQAKVAVEKATEGSKAWDRAISSEEKALQAEIRYWDKRAHNDKLSAAKRDAALRKELSYEKQLKQLTTATAQAAVANEKQFLSTYLDIQNSFGSNATPIPPPPSNAKTNTHLYDLKNEARESNRHLKAIRTASRFPASQGSLDAAMAVTG